MEATRPLPRGWLRPSRRTLTTRSSRGGSQARSLSPSPTTPPPRAERDGATARRAAGGCGEAGSHGPLFVTISDSPRFELRSHVRIESASTRPAAPEPLRAVLLCGHLAARRLARHTLSCHARDAHASARAPSPQTAASTESGSARGGEIDGRPLAVGETTQPWTLWARDSGGGTPTTMERTRRRLCRAPRAPRPQRGRRAVSTAEGGDREKGGEEAAASDGATPARDRADARRSRRRSRVEANGWTSLARSRRAPRRGRKMALRERRPVRRGPQLVIGDAWQRVLMRWKQLQERHQSRYTSWRIRSCRTGRRLVGVVGIAIAGRRRGARRPRSSAWMPVQ